MHNLTIPNCIPGTIKHFKHKRPDKQQYSPHNHTVRNYGAKQQYAQVEYEETELRKEQIVQQETRTFLYYAADPTILVMFIVLTT